jgi:HEAT repeat protein
VTTRQLPSVFAILRDDPNPAADAALVEALPDLEAFEQASALELIIRRGHAPALASVVIAWPAYGGSLAELIMARAGDMAGGIRAAINSPLAENRRAAVQLIVAGRTAELAYLLVDVLKSEDRTLRTAAAEGIWQITTNTLSDFGRESDTTTAAARGTRLIQMAEAVSAGLRLWDLHKEQSLLQAAAALEDRAVTALAASMREPQSSLPRMLGQALEQPGNDWAAGLVLRGLAMPEVRAFAVKAVMHNEDPALMSGVLRSGWLIADPVIEKSCRRLQPGAWVDRAVSILIRADSATIAQGVRLLFAMGGAPEQRANALRKVLDAPNDELRRAAVWALLTDDSDGSTDLLRVAAARGRQAGAAIASRELRRRARRMGLVSSSAATVADDSAPSEAQSLFARYWNGQDELGESALAEIERRLDTHRSEAQALARRRLASADPLDRVRALRMVERLAWTRDLSDAVLRSAGDPHPLVRGAAVAMLVEIPGPTTERLLRDAMNDVDERVQANAVEAMDRLNLPSRAPATVGKLASRSGRVRANAIKSLLRMEMRVAAEALMKMLEDTDAAHRVGALWVLEHIGSGALWDRVEAMSRLDTDERVRLRARRILRVMSAPQSRQPKRSGAAR